MDDLEQAAVLGKEVYDIRGYDRDLYRQIRAGWDSVAKPLDSMGTFEEVLSRIGAIQGTMQPKLDRCRILVSCADNGIVEEGVTQSGQEITAICAENIANGRSSVAIMAAQAGADLLVVDIGIHTDRPIPNVRDAKVRQGTRNFRKMPAMTMEETLRAMRIGMDLVKESRDQGYRILGIGEMGIGNTTTSSAVTAALLGLPAKDVTGRGAGLSDEKLAKKVSTIQEALDRYDLYRKEPLEVLACVGGLDIACMAGICMGGALYHVPIVLDGFISLAAALISYKLDPIVGEYLIPSHSGKEPAMRQLETAMGLTPVLYARMALGEGTGAVMMLELLRLANAIYEKSCSFENAGIEQYRRY